MDLTKGIVCILDASDKPAGTGFVVADDLIVTCAHVLGEPRPAHVTVVFQATNERRETKVIDEWWRSEDAEDVAILQVIGTLSQAVSNGHRLASLLHEEVVTGVAFSPDGLLLAVISPDFSNAVRVWDIASGLHLSSLQHQNRVTTVAFSPNGHLLASADLKGFIAVWDISSWHRLTTFAYEGVVTAVAFSPNGHLLAIADLKGFIAVWDISNGYRLTTFFSHEGAITAVTFSLDGHLLITASKDKTVRIWPWRPDELLSDACSRLTRNLTVEEWRRYIGDEPYRRTCANLP